MQILSPFARLHDLAPPGGPGLACGDDGVTLGPVTLIAVDDTVSGRSYRLLPFADVAEAFDAAYGPMPGDELRRRYRNLAEVARCLNAGDLAKATMTALLMRLPEIAPDGMAKLGATRVAKEYNPDQPRVPKGNSTGGQWTSGDTAGDATAPAGNTASADSQSAEPSRADAPQTQLPEQSTGPKPAKPAFDVMLPDGSKIRDPSSPTGYLQAPVSSLDEVARAGKEAGDVYRFLRANEDPLKPGSETAPFQLLGTMFADLFHGGTFDYQREGRLVIDELTGQFVHYRNFVNVSNLAVGLYCQQAGLSLEDTLSLGNLAASIYSNNASRTGLNANQEYWIRKGYEAGQKEFSNR